MCEYGCTCVYVYVCVYVLYVYVHMCACVRVCMCKRERDGWWCDLSKFGGMKFVMALRGNLLTLSRSLSLSSSHFSFLQCFSPYLALHAT